MTGTHQFSLPPDPRPGTDKADLDAAHHNSFPVVASSLRRSDRTALVAGGALALALGGLTFAMLHQTAPQMAPKQTEVAAPMPNLTPPSVAPPPLAAQLAAPARLAASTASKDSLNPVALVYDTPMAQSNPHEPMPHSPATSSPNPQPMLNENEAFGARVGNGSVETASAARLANPALTVVQGTLIGAVLETAIDSDLPGYARAVVSQDVRGFDGSRVLIPRGSRLIGQYKSGLQAGQTRVFVMWQRLIRPDGASVMLASPAIEFSGRSGLSGKVDSHFLKRYSAAILLSVLSGAGAVAGSGTNVVISSGSQGAASVAAQNDGKVPPTVRVSSGQAIRLFTARDLDFATVEP